MKPTQSSNRMRRLISALAVLLTLTFIGSTWALRTQKIDTRNEYKLGKFSTQVEEEFEAPDDWQPGVDVNKDVTVENTGTVPVFVKVRVGQEWIRRENVFDANGDAVAPLEGEAFPLKFESDGVEEYAAQIQWSDDVVLLVDAMAKGRSAGMTKVTSAGEAEGKWLLMNPQPDENGELTLYYVGILDNGMATPKLIDSVTMNPKIQASVTQKDTVWDEENEEWVTTETTNPASSYENAHYTLSVTMETVQATKEALQEMFPSDSVREQSVITYLETFGVIPADEDTSYDDSVTTKLLYLDAHDGTLRYTPVRNGSENWFMSHLNMIPGGEYTDTLTIKNRSLEKRFDLYMKAVPLTQDVQLDELLEYINMKVYYADELVYDGTASGKDYPDSINNLQDVIRLGHLSRGTTKMLSVELELDKDTPIEMSDLLTQIDWQFIAKELPIPNTGDSSNITLYIVAMVTAGTLLICCLVYLHKSRKKPEHRSCNSDNLQ